MKIRIYIDRDAYGRVTWASHNTSTRPGVTGWREPIRSRLISTTKQLAFAMLQSGTSKALFNAAWRVAVAGGQVSPSRTFKHGDPFDVQTIEYAKQEAFQVDAFISELVNNPKSKFYIYG